jgi:hypothetical protein
MSRREVCVAACRYTSDLYAPIILQTDAGGKEECRVMDPLVLHTPTRAAAVHSTKTVNMRDQGGYRWIPTYAYKLFIPSLLLRYLVYLFLVFCLTASFTTG